MKTLKIFALLLISFNLSAQSNDELLIKACLQGDFDAVKKAVEAGANVNAPGTGGASPLSSCWFWPEITQYLIDKGANPNGLDAPPLVTAARFYSLDVMKILLKAGADPNKPYSVKADGTAMLKQMVEDEKAKGKAANKALIKAYESMIEKAAKTGGTQVTITALQMAINFTNCKECLELLLNAGAKTDAIDANNRNLLHSIAFVYVGNKQRVAMLQKNIPAIEKSGVRFPDWYRNLDPSQYGNAGDMIGLLKNKGVDILMLDKYELSPLQLALSRDSLASNDLILGFINNGANALEDVKKRGSIIVQAAAYCGPDVIEALVAKGADINHEDTYSEGHDTWKGFTPLINAAKTNNLPTVKYLVEHGAKVTEGVHGTGSIYNYKTGTKCEGYEVKNKSLIFFAIESGNLELVKYLVESKNLSWKNVEPMEYKVPKGMAHTAGSKCWPFGIFGAPAYANKNGFIEIGAYLKKQDLAYGFFKK